MNRFTLLSVAFRVVQMISFSFCLQIGLHPNFFEKGAVDLLAHTDQQRIQAQKASGVTTESLHAHGVGVGSTTGKTCIGWPLFPAFTDILWALVACCILGGGVFNFGGSCWRKYNSPLQLSRPFSDPLMMSQCDNLWKLPRAQLQVFDQLYDIMMPLTGRCEEEELVSFHECGTQLHASDPIILCLISTVLHPKWWCLSNCIPASQKR